jgi:hypothetical protein
MVSKEMCEVMDRQEGFKLATIDHYKKNNERIEELRDNINTARRVNLLVNVAIGEHYDVNKDAEIQTMREELKRKVAVGKKIRSILKGVDLTSVLQKEKDILLE